MNKILSANEFTVLTFIEELKHKPSHIYTDVVD